MRYTTLSWAQFHTSSTQVPAERVPTVPRQADGLECAPNHPPPNFVQADRKPITGVKNHTNFWITHGPAVLVQDFRQGGNYRHGITAGTCLWRVDYRHPNRAFDHQFGTGSALMEHCMLTRAGVTLSVGPRSQIGNPGFIFSDGRSAGSGHVDFRIKEGQTVCR
jgi:hypothetical protein